MKTDPQPDQSYRYIRIDVTVVLPRRPVWLLAGIAAVNLWLPDGLLDRLTLVLQAFARLVR